MNWALLPICATFDIALIILLLAEKLLITFENPVIWGWQLWDYALAAVLISGFLILGAWIWTHCDEHTEKVGQ